MDLTPIFLSTLPDTTAQSPADAVTIIVGTCLAALLFVATTAIRQWLKSVTEAVRAPNPDPGQPDVTVVRAAHDLAAAVEEVREDLTSLRSDLAETARRQESTDAWVAVVEGRIKGVATTQTEILGRLGKNESATAALHSRVDRLTKYVYPDAPPPPPPSPPPAPHWPTEEP